MSTSTQSQEMTQSDPVDATLHSCTDGVGQPVPEPTSTLATTATPTPTPTAIPIILLSNSIYKVVASFPAKRLVARKAHPVAKVTFIPFPNGPPDGGLRPWAR